MADNISFCVQEKVFSPTQGKISVKNAFYQPDESLPCAGRCISMSFCTMGLSGFTLIEMRMIGKLFF